MITNPLAKTVLCFGDSNTNGIPSDDEDYVRLAADVRWTGRLQRLLGDGFYVIEEGLSGRTTDIDDEERPGSNGRPYFLPCLQTHGPLDAIVLMLGINDLKTRFGRTPADVATALAGYLDDIESFVAASGTGRATRTILVSPIRMDASRPLFADFDAGSVERSGRLADELGRLAEDRGVHFADAATVARAGGDGLHLSLDSHEPLAELIAAAVRRAVSGRA
jgi:lysophospholipase L1-like esterase